MKCANDENKGNWCIYQMCPRSGYEGDWKDLTDPERDGHLCPFRRKDSWTPKLSINQKPIGENKTK
jgi:hypothetical protein